MSSGTLIIKDSLRLIGAHSIARDADADAVQLGMRRLNGMIAEWEDQGIILNAKTLKNPGDPLDEPDGAYQAIIENLAVRLSPNYDNGKAKVSRVLAANARISFMLVKDNYRVFTIPKKKVSSTCPVGEGNSKGINRKVYFGKEREIEA